LPTFEAIDVPDELFPISRGKRGSYKTKPLRIVTDFEPLDESQINREFELVTPEYFDSLPSEYSHKSNSSDSTSRKPVCFVDGEGANDGEKTVATRKRHLRRWVQKQNYALLGATLQSGEYRCIVGENNTAQLSTKQCLDFVLSLPGDHVLIGYALTYDIEHWLKDLRGERHKDFPDRMAPMERLMRTQAVWWHGYRIHYIPNKIFTIGKYKGKKKIASRSVYDTFGFYQSSFKSAIRSWSIGTPEEWEFIDRMKDARADFGPITEETKQYNNMEGIHGVAMFRKLRDEYTKMDLRVPRPVGAGSIASAMFRKHGVEQYYPTRELLQREVMLSLYFGGRFDITRTGFVGDVFEYDINSAYPYIASTLPCLRCGRYVVANGFGREPHSLWLVRWKDNGTKWSPFPYRTDGGHIRYYASGVGYYFTDEVLAARRLDPSIEILDGFRFEQGCDHSPFGWITEYYRLRQEMVRNGDFGEKVIKLGLNSVYGKLAQSKGRNPRWQQLIWAGLITSGTRAMIMNGIAQNPDAIVKVATDALFSTVPLDLDIDEYKLGAWKSETLYDLLVLGNGVYQSTGSSNPKHADGVAKNRGFDRESRVMFDWDVIRENYRNGITSTVMKHEFRRFVKAFHERKLEERCNWIDSEVELRMDIQKMKRVMGEEIWPAVNPTPNVISGPAKIRNLNVPGETRSVVDSLATENEETNERS